MSQDDHIELQWIKRILIGLITLLMAHMAGGIWWAATMTADMKNMRYEISALGADRYRSSDAVKDLSAVSSRIERTEARVNVLESYFRPTTKGGA